MKNLLLFLSYLVPQALLAIHIHSIHITPLAAQNINLSLTTEADELYYFDSWNYSISGNVVTINAYFIEGFGSSMLYLNNNFEVALPVPQQYVIIVRILYTDAGHTFKTLQDMRRVVYRHVRQPSKANAQSRHHLISR